MSKIRSMGNSVLDDLLYNYPQLSLGIQNGMKDSKEYKDIVLRGYLPDNRVLPIESSGKEECIEVATPLGIKEVIVLPERNEFEYFIKVLAYRCEDVDIPKTTGAMLIDGINNWRKIEAHEKEFLKENPKDDWDKEFEAFTSVKENYKDTVLLVSMGPYSNLPYTETAYSEEEWLELSLRIRTYHELTHYISRKKYPDHKEAIRDEVIADCIGIDYALERVDKTLLLRVLGIKDGSYIPGSRLENYVEKEKLDDAVNYAKELVEKLAAFVQKENCKPFELLEKIEENYIR